MRTEKFYVFLAVSVAADQAFLQISVNEYF